MTTPPSSLPSPAPSSSSSSHPTPFSMSHIPPQSAPARAPSAASGRECNSGQHLSNGPAPGEGSSPPQRSPMGYDDGPQQTPQPPSGGSFPITHTTPSAYLPPVTSSPPPFAPQYVPPPQHALAPDPIHGMQMGMMGQGVVSGASGWHNGPGSGPGPGPGPGGMQNQWRPGPSSFAGAVGARAAMPNGHTPPVPSGPPGSQHMPPPNSLDPYPNGRSSIPIGGPSNQAMLHHQMMMNNGSGRPSSAHGEGRERRRERERSHREDERDGDRDGREEEVISTIFVVGFPEDMSVGAEPCDWCR